MSIPYCIKVRGVDLSVTQSAVKFVSPWFWTTGVPVVNAHEYPYLSLSTPINFPLLYRCSVGCGKLCLRRVNPALLNPCHRWPVVMPVRTLTAAPTVQEVHHPWEILVCSPITLQSVVFTCPRFSLDLDIENDSDLLKTVPIRHNTYKFIRYFW